MVTFADTVQLATGYVPLLIQMYATAAFEFDQGDNGWLMAEFAFVRGFFLILLFPPIIAWGRKFMASRGAKVSNGDQEVGEATVETGTEQLNESTPEEAAGGSNINSRGTTIVENDAEDADEASKLLTTDPGNFDMPAGEQVDQEPITLVNSNTSTKEKVSPVFDLVFLRWSLVVDGSMTVIAAFATQRWHIYLGK